MVGGLFVDRLILCCVIVMWVSEFIMRIVCVLLLWKVLVIFVVV